MNFTGVKGRAPRILPEFLQRQVLRRVSFFSSFSKAKPGTIFFKPGDNSSFAGTTFSIVVILRMKFCVVWKKHPDMLALAVTFRRLPRQLVQCRINFLSASAFGAARTVPRIRLLVFSVLFRWKAYKHSGAIPGPWMLTCTAVEIIWDSIVLSASLGDGFKLFSILASRKTGILSWSSFPVSCTKREELFSGTLNLLSAGSGSG